MLAPENLIRSKAIYLKGLHDGIRVIMKALREAHPNKEWDAVESVAFQDVETFYTEKWPDAYALYKRGEQRVDEKHKWW